MILKTRYNIDATNMTSRKVNDLITQKESYERASVIPSTLSLTQLGYTLSDPRILDLLYGSERPLDGKSDNILTAIASQPISFRPNLQASFNLHSKRAAEVAARKSISTVVERKSVNGSRRAPSKRLGGIKEKKGFYIIKQVEDIKDPFLDLPLPEPILFHIILPQDEVLLQPSEDDNLEAAVQVLADDPEREKTIQWLSGIRLDALGIEGRLAKKRQYNKTDLINILKEMNRRGILGVSIASKNRDELVAIILDKLREYNIIS